MVVFPEPAAIGPVMNLIGIAQGLRELGHECIFILDPGIAGKAAAYGFEERHLSCMEPMTPEASAKYWDEFMQRYLPTFRTSPYEQISTYVKGCWEAFRKAARAVCGPALADALEEDLAALHDEGLGALDAARRAALRARYAGFDEPCAREVVAWLDGRFEPSAQVRADFDGWNV